MVTLYGYSNHQAVAQSKGSNKQYPSYLAQSIFKVLDFSINNHMFTSFVFQNYSIFLSVYIYIIFIRY